jgi:hypothetical protein
VSVLTISGTDAGGSLFEVKATGKRRFHKKEKTTNYFVFSGRYTFRW